MIHEIEIMTISERMGEAVHNAWMDKRKKEKSWHNPKECKLYGTCPPYKDGRYCPNCHPCMKPYSELPDTEKDLDRQYPKIFFEILDDMGYEVVMKRQSQPNQAPLSEGDEIVKGGTILKCIHCGLEVKDIHEWKDKECPKNEFQHEFRASKQSQLQGEVGVQRDD